VAVIVREKKKGSGEWWVFINHKSKRRSKKIGDKRAANAVKREVETRLAKGDLGFLKEKKPSLARFGKKYVNDPDRPWAANTRTNYERLFGNHIKPHAIGKMPLDQVAMHHVKDFIGDLNQKDLAKGTIQFIVTILHGIFEEARVYEHVTVNPCSRTGKFIVGNDSEDDATEEINAYTPEEAAEQIERSKSLGVRDHAIITLLIRAGVRIGEALGLNWGDINFESRTAVISKNWDYKHKILGPTKTRKAREIDLTPYVVEVLAKLREKTNGLDSEPVFCDGEGERLSARVVRAQYYKVRLRDNVTLQDLRHTYATIRIAKGDNIIDVSRQLGHTKPSMTLDVYSNWLPRHHKRQVDELDSLHSSAPHTHPEPQTPVTRH
jgi:integrase